MSQKTIRHANATRIFQSIRAQPGATQREIVQMSSADKSTVSNILRSMEEQCLVRREERAATGGRGRPSEGYVISGAGGVVVGVNLRSEEMRLVLADLAGEVLAVLSCPLPADVLQLGRAMQAGIKGILISAGRDEDALRAVGITVPGLVDTDGFVRHSPNLGWANFNPRAQLAAEIATPVFLRNNADSAALAELLLKVPPTDRSFMLVICGSGVGAGLIHDGQLYQGERGFSGEIGHQKIIPGGRACICGGRGCLDAYVSNRSLLAILAEAGIELRDFDALMELVKAEDPRLTPILTAYAGHFALGLGNAVTSTGLPDVVFSGGVARLYPHIEPLLTEAMQQVIHPEIYRDLKITLGASENDERPLGGVAVALEGCTGMAAGDNAPWASNLKDTLLPN